MRKYVVAMGLFWSTFFSLACGPAVWAKPADLPADEKIQCPEGQEKSEHGGITIDFDVPLGRVKLNVEFGTAPAPIDAVCPSLLPAYVEQLLQQVGELFFLPMRSAVETPDKEARRLFDDAEKCRRSGDYEKARMEFQRVHLLTPTSPVGRSAIDRIIEIEERMRESTEGQDAPSPSGDEEESLRDLRERSEPLGMVEVSY